MEKRLSLADLKAKSISVLFSSELFTGGECENCHEGCGKPLQPGALDLTLPKNKF